MFFGWGRMTKDYNSRVQEETRNMQQQYACSKELKQRDKLSLYY